MVSLVNFLKFAFLKKRIFKKVFSKSVFLKKLKVCLGLVWYVCLKIENCCLKIFVEIRVGEKMY